MSHPMKILLVEDHADSARAMAIVLRMEGHAVKTAGGVGAATRLAADADEEGEPFDVLLCDLGLPDGSGLDLMRQLKGLYSIKGVAVTGSSREEDLADCREAGFDAHLTKPLAPDQLHSILESLGPSN